MLIPILYLYVLAIENKGKFCAIGGQTAAFEACLSCDALFIAPS